MIVQNMSVLKKQYMQCIILKRYWERSPTPRSIEGGQTHYLNTTSWVLSPQPPTPPPTPPTPPKKKKIIQVERLIATISRQIQHSA